METEPAGGAMSVVFGKNDVVSVLDMAGSALHGDAAPDRYIGDRGGGPRGGEHWGNLRDQVEATRLTLLCLPKRT